MARKDSANISPFPKPARESDRQAPEGAPAAAGGFPRQRPRRNRSQPWIRDLVAENRLACQDLIWPIFVQDEDGKSDISSLPGVPRYGLDCLVEEIGPGLDLGLSAIAVFPNIPGNLRTPDAEEAANPDNLVCRAVRALKKAYPDVGVICDVALDPFNSDGHDGLVRDGKILNDETVEVLCRQALVQAQAGCDIVAPSDMMDGRVGAIRDALDAAGRQDVLILSYAAKYASAFYGPFREAVGAGARLTGDKKTYQMSPANSDEALREVALDLAEGADMVMVKPGLPYLDIVRRVKDAFSVPTFAYQVSGEFAMMKAAAMQGWLDNDAVIMETLLAFKRAGADGILTYAAPQAARLLRRG